MPPATGIVLAGGASRRMGTDKRMLVVDGEPMLRRVARVVGESTDEVIVVVAPGRPLPDDVLDGLDARVAVDSRTDAGPLAGLETGLTTARHEHVVVVATDMPWIDGLLIRRLLNHLEATNADVVSVGTDGRPEPLLAAYRRMPSLEMATRLLDAGERRAMALINALEAETIADEGHSARNINEPADLAGMAP